MLFFCIEELSVSIGNRVSYRVKIKFNMQTFMHVYIYILLKLNIISYTTKYYFFRLLLIYIDLFPCILHGVV